MKKYYLGLFSIGLAVGLSAFTEGPVSNEKAGSKSDSYAFWYPVVDGLTSSASAAYTNVDETTIKAAQACQDLTSVICFAGSDVPLSLNTNVSAFSEERLVKRQ